MRILTSLHSIFQHEESLRREEQVEATGLEDLDEDGGQYSEEDEEGHEEGEKGHEDDARLYDEGVGGDGSASGPASSHRVRTIHLVRPPKASHKENMVVIVPSGDG
jgi:hypothetical protein